MNNEQTSPMSFGKRLWEGWKKIAAKIAHFQGHVILGIFYIVILAPVGILFRLFGQDALTLADKRLASYWVPRKTIGSAVEFLKRMY